MNLEKSKKIISKKAKKGFQGYPVITISYFGSNIDVATKVSVGFIAEENSEMQTEKFSTENDIREDEAIQSTIVKIIDRSGAKTVALNDTIIGCPHEEGTDFPEGEECPECKYWAGKVRVTDAYIQ